MPELIARGVEVHLVVPKLNGGPANEPLILPDGSPARNGSQVYRVDTGNQWGDFFTNTWHDNVAIEGFCTELISREGGFDLVHTHDWLSGFAVVALKVGPVSARFKGNLKITDPTKFWGPSRFLIVVEQ